MKWLWILRSEYDDLVESCLDLAERNAQLESRVAKLESLFAKAAERVPGAVAHTPTDIRRPMNTWRTRAVNFTKKSQTDPSTFPEQKES